MRLAQVQLAHVAALVLALTASACCTNVPDYVWTSDAEGVLMGASLMSAQAEADDVARCEAACAQLVEDGEGSTTGGSSGGDYDRVVSCTAVGEDAALAAWDPAQVSVTVMCTVEYSEPGFCTGRRPLGHHELSRAIDSRGAWFADMAHLESASIQAFVELAQWLDARGAPSELAERCRAAASDEIVHAELMAELALREGAELATPSADPPADDLLAVALHNASEGCVHEAFAALIAAEQARTCVDPNLRSVFARIAADELRHGQLAWDLHAWLMARLDDAGRAKVEAAQLEALARLPTTIRSNAARTPLGLGWPSPALAAAMAEHFAALVSHDEMTVQSPRVSAAAC